VRYDNCGIYKISCTANGKSYIGSSKQIGRRFYLHARDLRLNQHHSPILQRAWNKYGEASFSFDPIIFCSESDLLFYEQRAIDRYESANPKFGMNISPVAGRSAAKCSEERKQKMREDRTGKQIYKNNPERYKFLLTRVRRGEGHPMYGKTHTAEARAKISETHKGKPSWNKGIASPRKGIKRTPEDLRKITEARRLKSSSGMTIEKAREVRSLCASGEKRKDVASLFGVSVSVVDSIVNLRSWLELE